MTRHFTLSFRTFDSLTAKQARETLLNALTSGGLHESDIKIKPFRAIKSKGSRSGISK